jgi:hypothetical protein
LRPQRASCRRLTITVRAYVAAGGGWRWSS